MRSCTGLARILTLGVLALLCGALGAQPVYPNKPIHIIVPYPPGGSTDPMARLAAQKLAERWSQSVIVDNRPGGNTIIGTDAVAKAPADGYTILLASTAFVTTPSLVPYLPYDTSKDFDAGATIAKSRNVLVLNASVAANTLQELIALARSKPGQLNFASSGVGTSVHLAGELFNIMAETKIQHIPYKGSGPLISDLIGGQVQMSFQIPVSAISHIKSGKLKALAVTGETRLATLPQVPVFAEAGLPGFDMTGWYALMLPAGTPKAIIDKLSNEMKTILATPDTLDYLAKQGMEPYISTPGQVAALMKSDIAKFAGIIKTANIKLE